jgi:dynein heavy chain
MQQWRELDCRITDASNEARDNLKFLYSIEQLCRPLYGSSPIALLDSLPSLVNTIVMVHAVSRYYHTSERMTSLFVKVTNQMVSACKQYITSEGEMSVWDVTPGALLKRINDCQNLYDCYHHCFQLSKQRLSSERRPFEISEMYVFGKFSSFCRRLKQVQSVVETVQEFSVLKDSHIEGIDIVATRFQQLVSTLKKKPYDPLDHRKMEFASDFEDFQLGVGELGDQLVIFMNARLSHVKSCIQSLDLLSRFERLNLVCLSEAVYRKYFDIMSVFSEEIERVRKVSVL